MNLMRFDPYRELASLEDRLQRAFGQAERRDESLAAWAPPVDIYEHEGNIVLKAEIPGIDAKDVDVRVENNTLTLRGERKADHEVKKESYHRVERSYGAFTRSFTLPNVVDTSNIKAEYKDGVLRVILPKREEAKPKSISINVTR